MILKLESSTRQRIHSNIKRDELLVVLEGEIIVNFFSPELVMIKNISLSQGDILFIPANTPHTLTSVSEITYFLELIGGQYLQNSTFYYEKENEDE